MCDYSDACINADENEEAHKDVRFKNNALFNSCISRINNTFMNNAEDVVIPMGNLLEYSDNYSIASGSLWNLYRDEIDDVDDDALDDKSFTYKTKNNRQNTGISFTAWDSRTCWLTTTTTSTNFQCQNGYSTKVYYQFLEITWFTFD